MYVISPKTTAGIVATWVALAAIVTVLAIAVTGLSLGAGNAWVEGESFGDAWSAAWAKPWMSVLWWLVFAFKGFKGVNSRRAK